jgi:hypothetical protein
MSTSCTLVAGPRGGSPRAGSARDGMVRTIPTLSGAAALRVGDPSGGTEPTCARAGGATAPARRNAAQETVAIRARDRLDELRRTKRRRILLSTAALALATIMAVRSRRKTRRRSRFSRCTGSVAGNARASERLCHQASSHASRTIAVNCSWVARLRTGRPADPGPSVRNLRTRRRGENCG